MTAINRDREDEVHERDCEAARETRPAGLTRTSGLRSSAISSGDEEQEDDVTDRRPPPPRGTAAGPGSPASWIQRGISIFAARAGMRVIVQRRSYGSPSGPRIGTGTGLEDGNLALDRHEVGQKSRQIRGFRCHKAGPLIG